MVSSLAELSQSCRATTFLEQELFAGGSGQPWDYKGSMG